MTAPTPVRPGVPERTGSGRPPSDGENGHENGHGNGRHTGWPEEAPPPMGPRRRRSIWPFLLDLGLAMALFGLIITGQPLTVIGGVIVVVALAGWVREARADYSRLKD